MATAIKAIPTLHGEDAIRLSWGNGSKRKSISFKIEKG